MGVVRNPSRRGTPRYPPKRGGMTGDPALLSKKGGKEKGGKGTRS